MTTLYRYGRNQVCILKNGGVFGSMDIAGKQRKSRVNHVEQKIVHQPPSKKKIINGGFPRLTSWITRINKDVQNLNILDNDINNSYVRNRVQIANVCNNCGSIAPPLSALWNKKYNRRNAT